MLRLRARAMEVLEYFLKYRADDFEENLAKQESGITCWPMPPKKRKSSKKADNAESAADQTKGEGASPTAGQAEEGGVDPTADQAEGIGAGPVSSQTEEDGTDIGAITTKIKELNIEGPSGV